jgi:hypothetical protein
MRTAIFVYQTTSIKISTCESDLELCGMGAETVPLSAGDNAQTLAPGIYKIVSSNAVHIEGIEGDGSSYEVASFTKTNDPEFTPPRATETFTSLDVSALQAFLAAPDTKVVLNP